MPGSRSGASARNAEDRETAVAAGVAGGHAGANRLHAGGEAVLADEREAVVLLKDRALEAVAVSLVLVGIAVALQAGLIATLIGVVLVALIALIGVALIALVGVVLVAVLAALIGVVLSALVGVPLVALVALVGAALVGTALVGVAVVLTALLGAALVTLLGAALIGVAVALRALVGERRGPEEAEHRGEGEFDELFHGGVLSLAKHQA